MYDHQSNSIVGRTTLKTNGISSTVAPVDLTMPGIIRATMKIHVRKNAKLNSHSELKFFDK